MLIIIMKVSLVVEGTAEIPEATMQVLEEPLMMTVWRQMMEKQKAMMTAMIKCLLIQKVDLVALENLDVAVDLKCPEEP